jgi:D-aspartate ligase
MRNDGGAACTRGGTNIDRSSLDITVPALVLKVGSYPLHHGGLGVVRSLGRLGVPVYGVYEERVAPAAVSRHLSGRFVWRSDPVDADRFRDGMAAIGERLERPTVLIPTDDLGAILISEHAPTLGRWFRFLQPPPGLAQVLAGKKGLFELCSKLGVPGPQASFPLSRQDVAEFAARSRFPVVAKAIEAWLLPADAGLRTTTIVHDPEGLLALYRRLESGPTGDLMLQEYIPRGSGEDWFFHGYCNARRECLVSFTGVKLRSYPAYAGPTTLGRSQDNKVLRGNAEELLRAIPHRGIMDLDYRLDLRDGEYKLLDFNPRVGAQFRVFEDQAAVDVVRAPHLDLTGPAGVPSAAGRGSGVHRRAQRPARQRELQACRRPQPGVVAVLVAGIPPGAGLVRPRRPGSVPAHVRALPAQRRPAGSAAPAAPCVRPVPTPRFMPAGRRRRRP